MATDQNLANEIQYTLLETANNGASYGSGLFSATEVAARMNYRLNEFIKRTSCRAKRDTSISTTADTSAQSVPADTIDIIRVGYPDTDTNIVPIPRGSRAEAENTITDLGTAVDVPDLYTHDDADVLQLTMLPPPDSVRTIDYIIVPQATTLPATPDGTTLDIPDDLTPFVKYGVLADLFSQNGETHDPFRAQLCQALFDLGVQATQGLNPAEPQ